MASLKRTFDEIELDEIETSNKLQELIKKCRRTFVIESDRDDEICYQERMYARFCMQWPTSEEIAEIANAETEIESDEDELEYCPSCGEICEHFYGGRCITCSTSDSQPADDD